MEFPSDIVYYPSCVVNIKLLFDSLFVPTADANIITDPTTGQITPDNRPPKRAPGLRATNRSGKDGSHLTYRIPKTCSVELPAYRQAGTFKMTFDFAHLPIDPRVVRSAAIEIYMDSVRADDFARNMFSTTSPGSNTSAASYQRITSGVPTLIQSADNLAMMGTIDSWHVQHTANGSEVSIEGRDLVGILLDTPCTIADIAQIKLERPIDDVIRELIGQKGWLENMQVIAAPDSEWPKGVVPYIGKAITSQITDQGTSQKAVPRARKSVKTKQVRLSTLGDPDKMNFWDVITRWCYYVGAVPCFTVKPDTFFQNVPQVVKDSLPITTLLIRPAPTLYAQQTKGRVRRMMFGSNISELNYERKFTGKNVPKIIKVVSYDTSSKKRGTGKLLEVTHPDPNGEGFSGQRAALSQVAPNGTIAMQDILRIPVPGCTDKSALKEIAKSIYEELGRGMVGGSCHTKSLASFGKERESPDLVRLRPGDAIELNLNSMPLSSQNTAVAPLLSQAQESPRTLLGDLTQQMGGDVKLAYAVAQSLTNITGQLLNTYRVSNVKLDWNVKSGISLAFDFQNYIVGRDQNGNIPGSGTLTPRAGKNVPGAVTKSRSR